MTIIFEATLNVTVDN